MGMANIGSRSSACPPFYCGAAREGAHYHTRQAPPIRARIDRFSDLKITFLTKSSSVVAPELSQMAFQSAVPRPFTHRGFHHLQLQHREFMARAVVNPPPAQHEDWAIVSFNHIPDFALHFGPIREILHEFLEDHNHIEVRKTQPSHLGRALVRLVNAHDRDLLVN
jgi:hypothetical protein